MRDLIIGRTSAIAVFLTCMALGPLPAAAQHVPQAERHRISSGYYDSPQGAPAPVNNGYSAVAYHADAEDVWATAQYNTRDGAESRARNYCNAAMGGGCKTIWQVNGYILVARTQHGDIYVVADGKKRGARKAMENDCKRARVRCTEFLMLHSKDKLDEYDAFELINRRQPRDMANVRRKYAAAFRDVSRPDNDGFLVTGYDNLEKAKADARQACIDETPGPDQCEFDFSDGGRLLALYSDATGRIYTDSDYSQDALTRAIRDTCKEAKLVDCRIEQIIDVRKTDISRYKNRVTR